MTASPTAHRELAEDTCIFGKSSYKIASAISQLVDTVRGSMLLNIVTFGYTAVYPANEMAGSCDVGYTLIRWPLLRWILLCNRVSTWYQRTLARNSGKLGKLWAILRLFLLFEMASSANLNNVLKQLTAIFRRLNSGEDALSELQVLKEHCGVFWPMKGNLC